MNQRYPQQSPMQNDRQEQARTDRGYQRFPRMSISSYPPVYREEQSRFRPEGIPDEGDMPIYLRRTSPLQVSTRQTTQQVAIVRKLTPQRQDPRKYKVPIRRRKRRFLPLLASLLVLIIIVMSSEYHTLATGGHAVNRGQNLSSFFNVQEQGSQSTFNQARLKNVVQAHIDQFAANVDKIKRAGGDVTVDEQKLAQDRATLSTLTSMNDAVALLIQIGSANTMLQAALANDTLSTQLDNFQQEAQNWADAHKYHDPYDGNNYDLNSSYLNMDGHNGIQYGEGAGMSAEINAGSPQAPQDLKDDYFLLSMLEANYEDPTPYNQPHRADQALLNYFGNQITRVLVVSLTEQALRIYNNGQLEQAFHVTTGRVYRPTPVGHFQLTQHYSNYTFTSYDSPGSPDYYAPVVVQHAIQFWNNGYLIHSSQWRKDYGPFTQFPHQDSGRDPDASTGSHGCINVDPSILDKLDATITYQTPLIIY